MLKNAGSASCCARVHALDAEQGRASTRSGCALIVVAALAASAHFFFLCLR